MLFRDIRKWFEGQPVGRAALWLCVKASLELKIRNEKCEMVVRRIKIWKRRGILIVLYAAVIESVVEGSLLQAGKPYMFEQVKREIPKRHKSGILCARKISWQRFQ